MKNWFKALSFSALIVSGTAMAFVDQIAVSPTQANSNQAITVSFRAGVCDGPLWPVTWELQGTGSTRDLIVDGLIALDPLFCVIPVGTTSINIGSLPVGDYEIHVKLVDQLDGFGGVPSSSFGSANISVSQAPSQPIPANSPLSSAIIILLILGVALLSIRYRSNLASNGVLIFASFALLQGEACRAAESFLLEVTLSGAVSAPSAEDIVEGYDFSSGQSPPFGAILVGTPSHANYLLPIRASGAFSAQLQAHPTLVRAQLERTVLIAYASAINRSAGMAALQAESVIESVEVPIDYEFSATSAADSTVRAKSIQGVPDWRAQVNLPQAWQRESGWARIGVLDNGYDLGHPDLVAFDAGGQFVGGNLITADNLDVGRLGEAQTVAQCVDTTEPSTCDANLDELQPVVLAAINGPCDVTVDDPIADGLLQPWRAGHGTHVLGLIGANHANAGPAVGACVHCAIQPMRVANDVCLFGRVVTAPNGSTIAAATTYLVDRGIQIVSMSHANNIDGIATNACLLSFDSASCRALEYAANSGVILVAASGNHRKRLGFPARDARVVAVGGVDEALSFWNEDTDLPPENLDDCPFVGFNEECGANYTTVVSSSARQELVAPARQVDSTMYRGQEWLAEIGCGDSSIAPLGDGYGFCTGTSMSTPIVAGVFGIVRSVNPLVLPGDPEVSVDALGLRDVMVATTNRAQLGQSWDPRLGYGMLDADAAVKRVLGVVAGTTVKNRVTPMFSMYGNTATDYAYSATPQGAAALILNAGGGYLSLGGSTPGYLDLPHDPVLTAFLNPQANFYVLTTEVRPFLGNPDVIPLFLLERIRDWPVGCSAGAGCNITNRDVTLATVESDIETMVADGFRYFGRQGFIYAPCASEPSCIPTGAERLYRKCKVSEDDCAVFLERDRVSIEGQGYTTTYPSGSANLLGYAYPNIDTDGDQLIDGMEFVIGTNRLMVDSDGDLVNDGQEFPQAGVPLSDPCAGPNVQCPVPPLFANGFE